MPIWRVKYDVRFGDDADRDTFRLMTQGDLRESSVFDTPADHKTDLNSQLVTDCRFNTGARARLVFRLWAGVLATMANPPMGVMPMGPAFGRPADARGRLHIHNCTHTDAVVQDCKTTQYSEVTV